MATLRRDEAEDILYEEARLLDERRYEEWLAMLTRDAIYWIPCNGEGIAPDREISIAYDDFARLRERIDRLMSGMAHAQSPPSKTRRVIGNVQIADSDGEQALVRSAVLLYELRRGCERVYAGRMEHRMRITDGRWKIAGKKVVLENNDEVIDNLTFMV
jgi:3-phenylpropionate/cinnamic acid dioxygenase small subunit